MVQRRGVGIVLALVVAAPIVLVAAVPARGQQAPDTCAFDPDGRLVTIVLGEGEGEEIITGALDHDESGHIRYQSRPCGDATLLNTDRIRVRGGAGPQQLFLYILDSASAFGPGSEQEARGASEIEISVDLGNGEDSLWVIGESGDDDDRRGVRIAFVGRDVKFNRDADVDIRTAGTEGLWALGTRDADQLSTSTVSAYLDGSLGHDVVFGSPAADRIDAGSGDDLVAAGGGADVVDADVPGIDVGGDDRIYGGDGPDTIYPGEGDDVARGGAGDDLIRAKRRESDGSDILSGGPGRDVADYHLRNLDTFISLDGRQNDGYVDERDQVRPDFEVVLGATEGLVTGTMGSDTLSAGVRTEIRGYAGDDRIIGGKRSLGGRGADTLTLSGRGLAAGGAGDDLFIASPWMFAHKIVGGPGVDELRYRRTSDVTVTTDGVADDGGAGEGDNVLPGIEVVRTGSGNDMIAVGTGAQVVFAGEGDDVVRGGSGSDNLFGEAGNDVLTGDEGFDRLSGADDDDVFHSRDQARDSLFCGPGDDNAVDRDAVDELTDPDPAECEHL